MRRIIQSIFVIVASLAFTYGVIAQACCNTGVFGDQDCNGRLSLVDYQIWRDAYKNLNNPITPGVTNTQVTPTTPPNTNVKPVGNVPGNFTLAFQDEFDGSSLDMTKWTLGTPWGGQFCQGEDYFTNTDYSVTGGNLNIFYRRRAQTINDCGIERKYNTVFVQSKGKVTVHSGQYIEWRLKPAKGTGFWNIAWVMPNSWPDDGCAQNYEMDVFEHLGKGNADALATTTHVRSGCTGLDTDGGLGFAPSLDYSQAFHTAAVNWFPDHTEIFIDGKKVFTSSKFNGHDEPGFVAMNGFLGRPGDTWAGPSDGSTPAEAVFQIDYVRVWNRN